MQSGITARALRVFHERLLAAYGRQYWWPVRDRANPRFEVLIGAVLTQHAAWTNAERALETLRQAGPLTAETLLAHADLAALIRAAGPHHVKAQRLRTLCRWFAATGGFPALDRYATPVLRRELLALKGIGYETADAILVYAFARPAFVADAYAFRVFERYGWWDGARRYESLRHAMQAAGPATDTGFYAELHALIVAHAKHRCHKRRPDCANCALVSRCAYGRRPPG